MRIRVFHSNLNMKNPIIFGNVRIMSAKHFPYTQLCPVSKRSVSAFFTFLMECGLLPISVNSQRKKIVLAKEWDSKPVQIISVW